MSFLLTEEEYARVATFPEEDLVELAVELDIPVAERVDHRELLSRCVVCIAELAAREGLPFSNYDREDLEALSPARRRALTRQLGLGDEISTILKSGRKVYRMYNKQRPRSQVPLVLPSLLEPLCRYLVSAEP